MSHEFSFTSLELVFKNVLVLFRFVETNSAGRVLTYGPWLKALRLPAARAAPRAHWPRTPSGKAFPWHRVIGVSAAKSSSASLTASLQEKLLGSERYNPRVPRGSETPPWKPPVKSMLKHKTRKKVFRSEPLLVRPLLRTRRQLRYAIPLSTAPSVVGATIMPIHPSSWRSLVKRLRRRRSRARVQLQRRRMQVLCLSGPTAHEKTTTVSLEGLRDPMGRVSVCGLDPQRESQPSSMSWRRSPIHSLPTSCA